MLISLLMLLGNTLCAAEKAKAISAAEAARAAAKGKMPPHAVTMPSGAAMPPGMMIKPGGPPGKPAMQPKSGKTPEPIKRPKKPKTPPNPKELEVRPDEKGLLKFNFKGQPWPAVLEWLAQVSKMSFDWQELPGDYLNLSTQRSYTVEETRDMFNRHLLSRGYTLLCGGEQMTVTKVKGLDPSMVPRVAPEDLEQCSSYDFVKVSFPLDWLLAENVVEGLKPLLSPNGKLTPLAASNRIDAMDAAVNLREIYRVLQNEQSVDSKQRLVQEFTLQYARAADVREQLQALLGMGSKPAASAPSMPIPGLPPGMLAKAGKKSSKPSAAVGKSALGVVLVVNRRRNSILVRAKADKMAIIVQAIEAIDVPIDGGQSLLANMGRMRVYRIVGVEPEPVVKALEEMGNLDPTTRLEIDSKNNAIIAYASLADHMMIDAVVKKLSGSQRSFHVRTLRRLYADEVAGTVMFMVSREPKKEKQQARPWWYSSRGNEKPKDRPDAFRVDADVERNRLILWANDIELAEVDNLLMKLGEIPAPDRSVETTRVIDTGNRQQTQKLIERIRRTWPSMGPNRLILPPAEKKEEASETPSKNNKEKKPAKKSYSPPAETTTQQSIDGCIHFIASCDDTPERQETDQSEKAESKAASPPPVKLSIGADGRLIISSQDTEALNRLEELVADLTPARKDYEVFRLKVAGAYEVSLILEDFFEAEEKSQRPLPWWMSGGDSDSDDTGLRLSKRRKLEFISDYDTNSILVKGADEEQLQTIAALINIYDQPPESDAQSTRQTEVIPLRYAKAADVSTAVKDVYRDLLSENDKALTGGRRQRGTQTRRYVFLYDDPKQNPQKAPRFKGLLSIGIDEGSNTLIVSAPGFLFVQVKDLIERLDEAAKPNNAVRIVKVGPGISAASLRDVLENALGKGTSRGASDKNRKSSDRDGQSKKNSAAQSND